MDIVTLPVGAIPPAEVDCIRIYPTADGKFELMGTALCDGDSVSFVPASSYASQAEAADAGIAWAARQAVKTIYVATDPEPSEADGPL